MNFRRKNHVQAQTFGGKQSRIHPRRGPARFLPDTTFMHLRRASDGAAIWLDLARSEGEAVRIDENGWAVIAHPPVYFLRNRLQNPLPVPEDFHNVKALQALLGIPGQDDVVLILAWLLAAYIPNMPVPMLALQAFMANKGEWTGSITELAQQLTQTRGRKFHPVPLDKKTRILQTSLPQIGLAMEIERTEYNCAIKIKKENCAANPQNNQTQKC